MFYVEEGVVKLVTNQSVVCKVDGIPNAVKELKFLFESHQLDDDRFTEEGIDREFQAPAGFVPNTALWAQDAPVSWVGVDGPELFRRYPFHAESYVRGCNEYDQEPTYNGFREWLITLRDSAETSGGW